MVISRGTLEDAAELAEFAARTFSEAFAEDNDPQDLQTHLDTTYGIEQQSAELADPNVTSILVRSGAALIAYAQVRRNPPPPCVTQDSPVELHRFYVDREAQGTGLALTLMHEVRRAAREFGGHHIWLGVWEKNPRAIAFYKKAGFVDVGSKFYIVGQDKQVDRVLVASADPACDETGPADGA